MLLETICIKDSEVLHLYYHNQRFNKARKELFGIESFFDLATILSPPSIGIYRCRILYDYSIQEIEYIPYQTKNIQTITLIESTLEYNYKYADRSELDSLKKSASMSDEILIIQNSLVTDTSIANIAFLENKIWITPKKPLLAGTTRQRLLDNGFLREKNIQADKIHLFDGVALMNAMVGFKIITPIWMKAEVNYG